MEQSYPQLEVEACRRALDLARAPVGAGTLTRAFIDCFDELVRNQEVIAERANQERVEYVRPLIAVLTTARMESVRRLRGVVEIIPPSDLVEFEAVIRESHVLEEFDAFNTFLAMPPDLAPDQEKQEKGEKVINTAKDFLKELLDNNWLPGWVKKVIKGLLDVIDEVLQVLRGGKK